MLPHGKFRWVRHGTDSVTADSGHTDTVTRDTGQIGTRDETQVGHGK